MSTFTQHESGVRSYSRRWPVVFSRATGSHLHTENGGRYLDPRDEVVNLLSR